MGELKGRALAWYNRRGGRPWPDKCCGPGQYDHAKGCHPARPKCRWRRKLRKDRATCECGFPAYPHRIGSVDHRRKLACFHSKRHHALMNEWYGHCDEACAAQ